MKEKSVQMTGCFGDPAGPNAAKGADLDERVKMHDAHQQRGESEAEQQRNAAL